MKVAVFGGPRTGKSTFASKLARELDLPLVSTGKKAVVATDAFIGVPWADVPDRVRVVLAPLESWILEGCNAGRVIRRWLEMDPELKLDRVYWLERAWVPRNKGQEAMAKGCRTIFLSILPELERRGVPIVRGLPDAA